MCKVSVIVPVYNVEKYLPECIDSLLKQTFEDVEFIFVNDGSTDLSSNILEKYKELDQRIIIINKTNGGVVTTRPIGLKSATGQYIMFLDSDDTLPPNAIETMYSLANSNNCEIVAGSHDGLYNGIITRPVRWKSKKYDRGVDFLADSIAVNNFYLWGKLFHKELFNKEIIYGDSNYGEDGIFLIQILKDANAVITTNTVVYNYRLRDDSLTSSPSTKLFMDRYRSSLFIYNYVVANFSNKHVKNIVESYFIYQVYKMLIDCGDAFISKYRAPVFSVDMLRNNKKNILKKSFLAYYILSVYAHHP
ncbi:TPA: glycosyltransferase family 2 protein, partial [Escherichia coli]|nr:glycosyltransferase family 2 protein [Escherichia coli]HCP4948244.1 glycosyltransferase family 2 protein [Escherichia coli]HEH7675291.1 glycosyltransferase family 2 protein [Escherichia coli]